MDSPSPTANDIGTILPMTVAKIRHENNRAELDIHRLTLLCNTLDYILPLVQAMSSAEYLHNAEELGTRCQGLTFPKDAEDGENSDDTDSEDDSVSTEDTDCEEDATGTNSHEDVEDTDTKDGIKDVDNNINNKNKSKTTATAT